MTWIKSIVDSAAQKKNESWKMTW